MRRARDKIDPAVAQGLIGPVVWEDELVNDIEPFFGEEAKLDGGDRRKVRVRNEIRYRYPGNAHDASAWDDVQKRIGRYFDTNPGA